MATVRFSETLREEILIKARQSFEPAVIAAQKKNVPDPQVWFERVWYACFSKYETALIALPSGFLHSVDAINIEEIGSHTHAPVKTGGLRLYNAQKRPFPLGTPVGDVLWREFGLVRVNTWGNDYKITAELHDSNTTIQELADICRVRTAAICKAVQRRDEYVTMVKQVINSSATLAPALKMWPPLWDLLNPHVKDKHREVVTRASAVKKDELAGAVDFDRLTALAVISKMGAQ